MSQPVELSLRDILMGSGGAAGSPARPLIAAQRVELLRRWQDYSVHHPFRVGELVMEKDGLSFIRGSVRPTIAFIFWRALDFNNYADRRIVAEFYENTSSSDRVNCLVGRLSDDGETILFMPHDARKLRPLNDAERAELEPLLDSSVADQSDTHVPAQL